MRCWSLQIWRRIAPLHDASNPFGTVGREAKSRYNEPLGGQGGLKYFDVDPYGVPGDPTSGVLPMITTESYEPGEASEYMIAYNFRLQWTSKGGNKRKRRTQNYVAIEVKSHKISSY